MSATELADPPSLDVEETADEARLVARGAWLLSTGRAAERLIDSVALKPKRRVVMDLSRVVALDTAGAWLLHQLRAAVEFEGARVELTGLPEYRRQLIEEVEGHVPVPWAPDRKPISWKRVPEAVGRRSVMIVGDLVDVLNVLGAFTAGLALCISQPRRLRFTSIVSNFDATGLGAVPIMMPDVVPDRRDHRAAGAFYLRQFGAEVFVVDLVGVLVLREIGVILTAIMIAGRSGSAFTAEIGSMKMREEIDALHVIGMSPMEVLILPRLIALMIALPVLTFISDLAALAGAAMVAMDLCRDAVRHLPAAGYQDAITVNTLMVGIVKAPFMALIIGLVACVEGLKVEGSAESLGRQTTTSVVKAIFMVIVIDGVFRDLLRDDRRLSGGDGWTSEAAGKDSAREVIVRVRDVTVSFGTKTILDHLDLDVYRGEILGFVGGSGTGKSVLMRTILGLSPKQSGTIEVFGKDLDKLNDRERGAVERRWGVLFQMGALFSALTVKQNVQVPMREHLSISQRR